MVTGGSGGGVQVSADSLLLVATCCSCSSCDGLSVVAVVVVDTAPRPTLASPDRWSPPPLLQSLPPPPSQLTASSPVHESGIGLQMDVRGCPGCAIRRILPLSNLTSTPNSKSNCTCGKGPHPEKRSLEPEKHQSGELTAATYPAKPDVSHGQKC